MFHPVFTLVGLMLFINLTSVKTFTICQNHKDCGDGFFCYMPSKYCSKCTNCTDYHRKPGANNCSQFPLECGQCIEGYEESTFTHNIAKDYCEKANYNPVEDTVDVIKLIGIGFLVVFAIVLFTCYKKGLLKKIRAFIKMRAGHSLVPSNAINKTPDEFSCREDPKGVDSPEQTELSSAQLLPSTLNEKVPEEIISLWPSAPFNPAYLPEVQHEKETNKLSQSTRVFRPADTQLPSYNSTQSVRNRVLPPDYHAQNAVPLDNDQLTLFNAPAHGNNRPLHNGELGSQTIRLPSEGNTTRNTMPPDGDNPPDGSHTDGSQGDNASSNYQSQNVFVNNIIIAQMPITQNSVNTLNNNM